MKQQCSRRGFIAAAVLGTGALAASSLAGCSAPTQDSTKTESWDKDTDIVVVGAGFGGMVAAATALEDGAKVIVLESSVRTGGTGLLCSGTLGFGGKDITLENLLEDAPMADPSMLETYAEGWQHLTEWLVEIDAPCEEIDGNFKFDPDAGSPDGNASFADWLTEYIVSLGGEIMYQTRGNRLITDESGAVVGIAARDAQGANVDIKASKVILACGGFMGNKAMLRQYMGTYADQMANRGNPHNDGAGLNMGLAVGASLSRGLSTFYGYHLAYPFTTVGSIEEWDNGIEDIEWIALQQGLMSNIQGWSGSCCLVNENGKRYDDETQRDNVVSNETAHQKFARAYVILDSAIREKSVGSSKRLGKEKIDLLAASGASIIQADTIEELADSLSSLHGVRKAAFIRTIHEYNEACDKGACGDLDVPKSNGDKAVALASPPYFAIPAVPGVSLCYGGLKVNENSQVIDVNGYAIPGLYANQGVAGGVTYHDSVGVLASICSFAWIAGHHAAQAALSNPEASNQ